MDTGCLHETFQQPLDFAQAKACYRKKLSNMAANRGKLSISDIEPRSVFNLLGC